MATRWPGAGRFNTRKCVAQGESQTGLIEYDGVVLVGCFKEGEKDA